MISASVLILASCHRQHTALFSEIEIAKIVQPGVSRTQVEDKYGQPFLERPEHNGIITVIYRIPDSALPRSFTNVLTGFQVLYSSNRVTKFLPVYSDQSSAGK
jgi:hypothetical protein